MLLKIYANFTRSYCCTKMRPFKEVRIPVPWGHIAGKWWSPYDKRPVLTLHGWQDNSGSFDRLIPLLTEDVGFLAIDLPGHGYSSRLPQGMVYYNMNYPILIKKLQNYFQWPKLTLMGHSLGAISCFVYTMLFPETVDYLICLDGLKPFQVKDNVQRMAEGINEHHKYDEQLRSDKEPPSYTLDELKQIMEKVNFGSVDVEHCHYILDRNIAQSKTHPDKYYFTRDPRLKSRFILNWPHEEILEGTKRVTCPIFISKSSESGYYEKKQNLYDVVEALKKSSVDPEFNYVEGRHHVHLNNPEVLAGLVNKFITKHNKGDRTVGKSML